MKSKPVASLPTNRRARSVARRFHASCDDRNGPDAHATAPIRATFAGLPRFVAAERLNRIPRLRTEPEQDHTLAGNATANSNENAARSETPRFSRDAVPAECVAQLGLPRSRVRYLRSVPSSRQNEDRVQLWQPRRRPTHHNWSPIRRTHGSRVCAARSLARAIRSRLDAVPLRYESDRT